jgi:hypothetical protein
MVFQKQAWGTRRELRTWGVRPLLLLAVQLEIHLLVEEAQESFDLANRRDGLRIVPDELPLRVQHEGSIYKFLAGTLFL